MKNISVVVQGAVHPEFTPKCLASIRHHLPTAHIILSTWEGTDTTGLDADEIVFNSDPGAVARMYDPKKNIGDNPNNINRQIVSTLNGLKRVQTEYVLKMRTDFEIRHPSFLKYVDKFSAVSEDWRVFEHRILTLMGDKPVEKPLFPWDFLFFGKTSDVLNLFDIPLMTKENAEWFYTHEPLNAERYRFIVGLFKYIPEQHIWMSCLAKKYPDIWSVMKDCSDVTETSIRVGEQSFANNFVCLDFDQYGIYPLKDSLQWTYTEKRFHMFSHTEWLALYGKYSNPKSRRYRFQPLSIQLKLQKHQRKYRESTHLVSKLKFGLKCIMDYALIGGWILIHIHLLFKP